MGRESGGRQEGAGRQREAGIGKDARRWEGSCRRGEELVGWLV